MALLANPVTNTFTPKEIIYFSLCFCWAGFGDCDSFENKSLSWNVSHQRKASLTIIEQALLLVPDQSNINLGFLNYEIGKTALFNKVVFRNKLDNG